MRAAKVETNICRNVQSRQSIAFLKCEPRYPVSNKGCPLLAYQVIAIRLVFHCWAYRGPRRVVCWLVKYPNTFSRTGTCNTSSRTDFPRMKVYVMAVRISNKLSHEIAQMYEHYHPIHCLEMLQQVIVTALWSLSKTHLS